MAIELAYAYLMHFSAPVRIGSANARTVRHYFGRASSIREVMHQVNANEHRSAIVTAALQQNAKVSIGWAARRDHHVSAELTSGYARRHCKFCIAEARLKKQDDALLGLLKRSIEIRAQRRLFK